MLHFTKKVNYIFTFFYFFNSSQNTPSLYFISFTLPPSLTFYHKRHSPHPYSRTWGIFLVVDFGGGGLMIDTPSFQIPPPPPLPPPWLSWPPTTQLPSNWPPFLIGRYNFDLTNWLGENIEKKAYWWFQFANRLCSLYPPFYPPPLQFTTLPV